MTIRKSVLNQILPIPDGLTIEADEYIFTLAPAIAPAMILNEPLCYYGIHSGNLFQFGTFEPLKARRKMNVLEILMRELPAKLKNSARPKRSSTFCSKARESMQGGSA